MVGSRKIGREPIKLFIKRLPQCLGEPVHILQNGIKKPGYVEIVGNRSAFSHKLFALLICKNVNHTLLNFLIFQMEIKIGAQRK